MNYVIIPLSLLFAIAAVAAGHEALKIVPQSALQGVQVLSCEEKEPSYTVSCRQNNRCTITILASRVTCKAVRK